MLSHTYLYPSCGWFFTLHWKRVVFRSRARLHPPKTLASLLKHSGFCDSWGMPVHGETGNKRSILFRVEAHVSVWNLAAEVDT